MLTFIDAIVLAVDVITFVLIAVLDNPFSYVRRWQRIALRVFALCWAVVHVVMLLQR